MGCCTGKPIVKSRLETTSTKTLQSEEQDEITKKVDLIFQRYDTERKGTFTRS